MFEYVAELMVSPQHSKYCFLGPKWLHSQIPLGSTHERVNVMKEVSGSPSLSKMREVDEVGKGRIVLDKFMEMAE